MSVKFSSLLASRGVVRVGGTDAAKLLQSLVTADVHALSPGAASGTAFLDRRGRVLYGSMIHCTGMNEYCVDVRRTDIPGMLRHLKLYRLRASADVDDVSSERNVWQYHDDENNNRDDNSGTATDPRLPLLGRRVIIPSETSEHADDGEEVYEKWRVLHGVPDGNDFEQGILPLDLGLHLLNSVSFSKGCYLGQELTARTFFTGVLRRRLTAVVTLPDHVDPAITQLLQNDIFFNDAATVANTLLKLMHSPDSPAALTPGDNVVPDHATKKTKPAVITSAAGNVGLAVLRLSDTFAQTEDGEEGEPSSSPVLRLASDGRRVYPIRQAWWGNAVTNTVNSMTKPSVNAS